VLDDEQLISADATVAITDRADVFGRRPERLIAAIHDHEVIA
jgi:hypothetical protein